MKLEFEGQTLQDIHSKILAAADEIKTNLTPPTTTEVMYGHPIQPMVEQQTQVQSRVDRPTPVQPVAFNMRPEQTAHMPVAPVTPAPGIAGELDNEGFPHDARIHSGNREKLVSGVWRKRRGVDDNVVDQVKAELRTQGFGQATAAPAKQVPPFGSMPPEQYKAVVQPPPMPTTNVHQPLPVQNMPAQGTVLPFAPPTAQLPPNTYTLDSFKQNFVMIMNGLAEKGTIDGPTVVNWKASFGGKDIQAWPTEAEAIGGLYEGMISWGWINRA